MCEFENIPRSQLRQPLLFKVFPNSAVNIQSHQAPRTLNHYIRFLCSQYRVLSPKILLINLQPARAGKVTV